MHTHKYTDIPRERGVSIKMVERGDDTRDKRHGGKAGWL